MFRSKLANKGFYKISIGSIRLRLQELQETNSKTQELGTKDGYQDIDRVLHHQSLSFLPEAIQTKLISCHYNDSLAGHCGINKTWELIARKYFWPTPWHNVKAYVKSYDMCLVSKAIGHKPYGDLQCLPVFTQQWKDLSMDFVTGLFISTDWKGNSYNSVFVIVDQLTKMVHYKPVKIIIDALGLAKDIIDMVVLYHGLPNSIMTDKSSLLISKFWSLLYYFLGIKRRLFIAFYP